ncbi:oxygen-independent coproporphyrinogen-3 oxidase [Breznakibacter xylanolyticus]|uniref:Heme chaperone HemW n=1 Tax=Breznakibacter xylanolyticus TaxID=990 RepID=A0A2W7P7L9_9BACT|nr:radical SAM family heme chaperone HemW [Breznakibacter xylanolyticus]PZX19402.1 oxygen-independent coproporphyrinogen-3 oxidase [Breznakibacter xylanolyticus]
MAGVYVHVPFCKRKCFYCDFYKSTNLRLKNDFLNALKKEIALKQELFQSRVFDTFYVGGGTPSVLSGDELILLFDLFRGCVDFNRSVEVTIEINPDDFTDDFVLSLKQTPVNRISFGLQTQSDDLLKLMNRRHLFQQSVDAVNRAVENGYHNISVDLIYGLPSLSLDMWKSTLLCVVQLPIVHLSAYHLTYESGTEFYRRLQCGDLKEIDEDESLQQYRLMVDILQQYGFEQYEVSAFAKRGFYSRHNTLYWEGGDYIGFGPSAHSFYQGSRFWNVSDVDAYIQCLNGSESFYAEEKLTDRDCYNERIMLGLRTVKGFLMQDILAMSVYFSDYFILQSKKYFDTGVLILDNGWCRISSEHRFITDKVIEDLFFVE